MKILALLFCLIAFAATSAPAADTGGWKPLKLSEADQGTVARLQEYFNALRSFRADFLQIGDDIQVVRGRLQIKRPGRLRLEYAPPSETFMVADGLMLHLWDGEMQQSSSVPIEDTLANFILRDHLDVQQDVIITRLAAHDGVVELGLRERDNPEAGELTLVFNDRPLILRQWIITDMQGNTTRVFLEQLETDVNFDRDTFNFKNPEFGKKKR